MRCVLGKPIFLGDKKELACDSLKRRKTLGFFPKTYKHPLSKLFGMSICQSAFLAFRAAVGLGKYDLFFK